MSEEDEASWNSLISFTGKISYRRFRQLEILHVQALRKFHPHPFAVQMLGVLVSCVPAYSDDNEDLEHPALPAAKLLLDWFCENDALLRNENISVTGRCVI